VTTLSDFLTEKPIDAMVELGAYEHLWQQPSATTSKIAKLFAESPRMLPSDLVPQSLAEDASRQVVALLRKKGVQRYGVRVHGMLDYPAELRDAKDPVEVLYFRGAWELASAPRRVAVVGTRKVSAEGAARTRRLVKALVKADFTVVSGLAEGVDTIAHETAIECGGRTIAVIGTPITENYPRANASLQQRIAEQYLLISQVPLLRYQSQSPQWNRLFFPERNKTMSALTAATVIVEAGETSGTLIQAEAALHQGRQLFILASNFDNPAISWPARFEKRGAHRVHDFDDILTRLS